MMLNAQAGGISDDDADTNTHLTKDPTGVRSQKGYLTLMYSSLSGYHIDARYGLFYDLPLSR